MKKTFDIFNYELTCDLSTSRTNYHESYLIRRSTFDIVDETVTIIKQMLCNYLIQEVAIVDEFCFKTIVAHYFLKYIEDHPEEGLAINRNEIINIFHYIDTDNEFNGISHTKTPLTDECVTQIANAINVEIYNSWLNTAIKDFITKKLNNETDYITAISNLIGYSPIQDNIYQNIDSPEYTISCHISNDETNNISDDIQRHVQILCNRIIKSKDNDSISQNYCDNYIKSKNVLIQNIFSDEDFIDEFYIIIEQLFKNLQIKYVSDIFRESNFEKYSEQAIIALTHGKYAHYFSEYEDIFKMMCFDYMYALINKAYMFDMFILFVMSFLNFEKSDKHLLIEKLKDVKKYNRQFPTYHKLNASLLYFNNITTDDLVELNDSILSNRSDGECFVYPYEFQEILDEPLQITINDYFYITRHIFYYDLNNVDLMPLSRYALAYNNIKFTLSGNVLSNDYNFKSYDHDCDMMFYDLYRQFDQFHQVDNIITADIQTFATSLTENAALANSIVNQCIDKINPIVSNAIYIYNTEINNISTFNCINDNCVKVNLLTGITDVISVLDDSNREIVLEHIKSSYYNELSDTLNTYITNSKDYFDNSSEFYNENIYNDLTSIVYNYIESDDALSVISSLFNCREFINAQNYELQKTEETDKWRKYLFQYETLSSDYILSSFINDQMKIKQIDKIYNPSFHMISRSIYNCIPISLKSAKKIKIIHILQYQSTANDDRKTYVYKLTNKFINYIIDKYHTNNIEFVQYVHGEYIKILNEIQTATQYDNVIFIIDVHGIVPKTKRNYNSYAIQSYLIDKTVYALHDFWFLDKIKNIPNVIVFISSCFGAGIGNEGTGEVHKFEKVDNNNNFILRYSDSAHSSSWSTFLGDNMICYGLIQYYSKLNKKYSYNDLKSDIEDIHNRLNNAFIRILKNLYCRFINKLFETDYDSISDILSDIDGFPLNFDEYQQQHRWLAKCITQKFYDVIFRPCIKSELLSLQNNNFKDLEFSNYTKKTPTAVYSRDSEMNFIVSILYNGIIESYCHIIKSALSQTLVFEKKYSAIYQHAAQYKQTEFECSFDTDYNTECEIYCLTNEFAQLDDEIRELHNSIGQIFVDFIIECVKATFNIINVDDVITMFETNNRIVIGNLDALYNINDALMIMQHIIVWGIADTPGLIQINGNKRYIKRNALDFII